MERQLVRSTHDTLPGYKAKDQMSLPIRWSIQQTATGRENEDDTFLAE